MSKFDKLTVGEFKRLVLLQKQVDLAHTVVDDDVYWTFVNVLDGSHIRAVGEADINAALAAKGRQTLEKVEADMLHVKRWAEAGYISVIPSKDNHFAKFLVTPRGEDYLTYRKKGRLARWFVDLWSDLRTEIVSATVSAVISIIVSLITAYLVLTLGLK